MRINSGDTLVLENGARLRVQRELRIGEENAYSVQTISDPADGSLLPVRFFLTDSESVSRLFEAEGLPVHCDTWSHIPRIARKRASTIEREINAKLDRAA